MFITELHTTLLADGRTQRLDEPLLYRHEPCWTIIQIPIGFVTNYASTPRCLWAIFPPQGKWSKAAVLHDFLYSAKTTSRFMADGMFRDAMRELGVPLWRRVLMFYAVRAFGWINWRRCRKAKS